MDWLIVGLGNPGPKYEYTRHNVGFLVLDELAGRWGIKLKKLKFQSLYGEGGGKVLLKPQTFMNLSGQAVRAALEFYKLPPERLIVIYDDVSLPPGKLRLRETGSAGGHNGMKDILYHLRTDAFPRIKIGVGAKPHPDMDLADWVLSGFSKEEAGAMKETFSRAADAAEDIVRLGMELSMGRYN